jgi:hypothetical protein
VTCNWHWFWGKFNRFTLRDNKIYDRTLWDNIVNDHSHKNNVNIQDLVWKHANYRVWLENFMTRLSPQGTVKHVCEIEGILIVLSQSTCPQICRKDGFTEELHQWNKFSKWSIFRVRKPKTEHSSCDGFLCASGHHSKSILISPQKCYLQTRFQKCYNKE